MNKVILIGRITKDIDLRDAGEHKVARFTLAVDRKKDETDFISCVSWNRTAELLSQYCGQGSRIAVSGRIQTGSYTDRNGEKKYTTEVVADSVEFLDKKSDSGNKSDGFVQMEENGTLPF